MMKRNKKFTGLTFAALTLVATLSIGSALAYFTSYTSSVGSVPLEIGFTTTIPDETIDNAGKHIRITNTGDYDCFVRVLVIPDIPVSYTPGDGWEDGGDGYWYYRPVLAAGATTSSELLVSYTIPAITEDSPAEEFNIIVLQECTPVVYDVNNNPAPDWTWNINDTAESTN